MSAITDSLALLWEALFLQPQPYEAIRDRKNPAGKGAVILIVLGLVLALASLVGAVLTWASSPDLTAIKDAVLSNLQQMTWWPLMAANSQVEATWFQIWDTIWSIMSFVRPSPINNLAGFITRPLLLLLSWFVFGLVAHPIARLFGGRGSFGQTLGTTSLAAAPEMLGLLSFVPYVALAGIGIWTLLARYMAVRVAHDLSWGRAVWVVILTMLVLFLLGLLLIVAAAGAIGAALNARFMGG
ncbi:MAG: YIP1 family protein [Candidatus Promineifilaceae bacterium]